MPREHFNDVPGDIVASDAENLPGGFGAYNPDNDTDATVDELTDFDVRSPNGTMFTPRDARGGDTAGTSYSGATTDGSTVNPDDLLAGEEAHPGAAVGFTGAEPDKRGPSPEEWRPTSPSRSDMPLAGGAPSESEMPQQAENISTESEGPVGAEGGGGTVRPDRNAA